MKMNLPHSAISMWFCKLSPYQRNFWTSPEKRAVCLTILKVRRDTRAKIYAFVIFLQFKLNVPRLGCQQIAALRFKDMSLGDVTL